MTGFKLYFYKFTRLLIVAGIEQFFPVAVQLVPLRSRFLAVAVCDGAAKLQISIGEKCPAADVG